MDVKVKQFDRDQWLFMLSLPLWAVWFTTFARIWLATGMNRTGFAFCGDILAMIIPGAVNGLVVRRVGSLNFVAAVIAPIAVLGVTLGLSRILAGVEFGEARFWRSGILFLISGATATVCYCLLTSAVPEAVRLTLYSSAIRSGFSSIRSDVSEAEALKQRKQILIALSSTPKIRHRYIYKLLVIGGSGFLLCAFAEAFFLFNDSSQRLMLLTAGPVMLGFFWFSSARVLRRLRKLEDLNEPEPDVDISSQLHEIDTRLGEIGG